MIKDLNAIIVHACSQSCLTPWTWGSPPGSSVHGILQARILEWVTIPFSRGSSQPRDRTYVSCGSCTGGWIVYHLSHVLLTKYNFLSNLISLAAITKYHRLGGFSSRHFSLLAGQYTHVVGLWEALLVYKQPLPHPAESRERPHVRVSLYKHTDPI